MKSVLPPDACGAKELGGEPGEEPREEVEEGGVLTLPAFYRIQTPGQGGFAPPLPGSMSILLFGL